MNEESKELAAVVGAAVASALQQPVPKTEIPAPLKWAAGIISALLTMAVAGSGAWLINTVNAMQITLTRLDERSINDGKLQEQRDTDFERRLQSLEGRSGRSAPTYDYPSQSQ
jgi:hypothetical protein